MVVFLVIFVGLKKTEIENDQVSCLHAWCRVRLCVCVCEYVWGRGGGTGTATLQASHSEIL